MNYIKQTRAKKDYCNICGRMSDLTWDHVPPKATLLRPETFASTLFGTMPSQDSHMLRYQSGIKYRSICRECNGEILGRNDIEFKKLRQDVVTAITIPHPENTITVTAKINRVLRAVCGHMIAMSTSYHEKLVSDSRMREFILDEKVKLDGINVYTWVYPYSTILNVRDVIVKGRMHPEGFISVMEAFPLAYMISDEDESECQLDNLSQHLTRRIDDEVQISLHLGTALYPGTQILKHYLWPMNVDDGPFGAAMVMGGEQMNASRIGVVENDVMPIRGEKVASS